MLACSAERRVLVCTIGTSPLSMRWWVVDACTLFTTPIIVSARTCQQWQVPPWPGILRTRRVDSRRATYGLYGVAANGLTMCMLCCNCCMYCMFCKTVEELWVEVGFNKTQFLFIFFILFYYYKNLLYR
jgi:hypothetical protein